MRDDVRQRSEAIQNMIAASKLDNQNKALLANNLASSAEMTNGLNPEQKLQALCLSVYQLNESIAVLSMGIAALPCHGNAGNASAVPCHGATATSPTAQPVSKFDKVLGLIERKAWHLVVLILVIYLGLLISPFMQHITSTTINRIDVTDVQKVIKDAK